MKNLVPFTQYLQPMGRPVPNSIEVGDAEFEKYRELASMGFEMTCEVLPNGMVAQYITDQGLGDYDICLCKNGPNVPVLLSEMLLRFDKQQAADWRKKIQ